jgi:hypothetical protein
MKFVIGIYHGSDLDDVVVNLGVVHACSQGDQLEVLGENAFLPDAKVYRRWFGVEGELMQNG